MIGAARPLRTRQWPEGGRTIAYPRKSGEKVRAPEGSFWCMGCGSCFERILCSDLIHLCDRCLETDGRTGPLRKFVHAQLERFPGLPT